MRGSLHVVGLLLLVGLSCPPAARASGTCQTAQPITTGTYPLALHDTFMHPNVWDTSYEWFRVTLQPGDQLVAIVTDIVVDSGPLGFGIFKLWEANPANCTGPLVADVNPLYGYSAPLTTTNQTGAAKDYVFMLVMLSGSDTTSLQLHCSLQLSVAPATCAGVADDSFEPNQIGNGTPATPGTYTNRLATSSNDDWYHVLVAAGATLTAQITFVNSNGDLDLSVGSMVSNGTNNLESASLTNVSPFAQFVDVRVHAKDGQFGVCNHYDLVLSIANPAIAMTYCTGAPNSTGFGGFLQAQGTNSVSANAIEFIASGLPPNAPALLFDGTTRIQTPFGDGFRCVGGSTHRIATVATAAYGAALYPVDLGGLPPAAAITPGSTWSFQVYYRNPAGPGGTGFNLTNGVSVTFQP